MSQGSPPSPSVRAGRPTRAQAEARHGQLLEAALDHFLDKGFEYTTIEAIAASVNMTKRTVYARYPEKPALFRAAVAHAIARLEVPEALMHAARKPDLAATLIAVAHLRVDPLSTPEGLKLQRIINAWSYRFPDIFTLSYERGALPVVRFLATLLEEETKAGRLAVADPLQAANVFMSMVVSGPVRLITSGIAMPDDEVEYRIRFSVELFLNGTLPRPETP